MMKIQNLGTAISAFMRTPSFLSFLISFSNTLSSSASRVKYVTQNPRDLVTRNSSNVAMWVYGPMFRTSSAFRRLMTSIPSFTCATTLPCVIRTTFGMLVVPDVA